MNTDERSIAKRGLRAGAFAAKVSTFLAAQRGRLESLSVLLLVRFITAGLGFVTTIQIANTLGKAMFGELAYVLALGSYGAVIVRYGLNRTLTRDLIHDRDQLDVLVVASLILRLALLLVVLFGLVLWRVTGNHSNTLSWLVICIVMVKSVLSLDLQPVYDAWHQFKRHAVYALVERCLYFACIWFVLLVSPGVFGLGWIALAMAFSTAFYMTLQHRWAFKRIQLCRDVSLLLRTIAVLLRRNVWMWVATIAALSFGSLNQILLRYLKGTSELGGYAVAWQLVVVADVFLLNVARIGNPATARITRPGTSAADRRRFMIKYIAVMLAVAAPICIPAIICPKLILGLLFRPEYLSAAPIMQILGVYVLLLSTGIAASQYVISARMEKTYLASVILGGALTVVLSLLLVPRHAGLGAGLAVLAGHGVSMLLYLVLAIRDMSAQEYGDVRGSARYGSI